MDKQIIINEEELSNVETKHHTPEGLFTGNASEIVDGLLKDANGDEELALKRINFYINRAGDGLSNKAAVHTAKKQLQKKLESKMENIKNSKFHKMISEALIKFKEDNERENQVYEVASSFANKYTCAEMADSLANMNSEIIQANEYAQQKINELNISEEEFEIALDKYSDYCKSIGTACIFNTKNLVFNN